MTRSAAAATGSRRRPRRVAAGLVLLTLTFAAAVPRPVGAQPSAGADRADGLQSWASRHYVVHTDLPREEAVLYGRHMDLIHRSYARFLQRLPGEVGGPQDIYLLRDRPSYLRVLARFGIDGSASGGMFFSGQRGPAWRPGSAAGRGARCLRRCSTRASTSSRGSRPAMRCRSGSTRAWRSTSATR